MGYKSKMDKAILCSNCFRDEGLRLDSAKVGLQSESICPNCGSENGRKLTADLAARLAHRFFVRGTIHRVDFGGAPLIQFNQHQTTSISAAPWLEPDLRLIENAIGVGFFRYGPRLWMVGEIEPLKSLQRLNERAAVIQRILTEYPEKTLSATEQYYRLRLDPQSPASPREYDSPPSTQAGKGRLDSVGFPVQYGSQDIQVCVHECRATVDDEVYVATLAPTRALRLLDLTELLKEDVTEFESLDLAVHMLFLAKSHSYEISRAIAMAAHTAGFDGLIYPSYFSLVRAGVTPFDTTYGISVRRIPQFAQHIRDQVIANIAVFGRPIEQGIVSVRCINKLVMHQVEYDLRFGPTGYD
jgi:hypothetical protein